MQLSFASESSTQNDQFDIFRLIAVLWSGKWVILATTVIFALGGICWALYLPNIYRAEALLAPAEETQGGGLAAMVGQLGGLASLAGVTLPKGQADKASLAVEVLKSRAFLTKFIQRRELLVPLMATQSWNPATRTLVIDSDLYDVEKNLWVRKVSLPKKVKPSAWEAYKVLSQALTVSREKDTGFVTIALDHKSPELAKNWVNWLINDVNEHIRAKDIDEANNSVIYLQNELEKTPVADMKKVFYQLIEKQIQTIMLANVRVEYVFKTVDFAVEPEDRYRPRRALICAVTTILGGVVGAGIVLVSFMLRLRR